MRVVFHHASGRAYARRALEAAPWATCSNTHPELIAAIRAALGQTYVSPAVAEKFADQERQGGSDPDPVVRAHAAPARFSNCLPKAVRRKRSATL